MSLRKAIVSTQVIETLENYSRSDLVDEVTNSETDIVSEEIQISNEKNFWDLILLDVDKYFNQQFSFHQAVLSEHVPRVPGMFFSSRKLPFNNIPTRAYVSGKYIHYSPEVKSQQIIQGLVGTLQIPPETDGWHIASICLNEDASKAIPCLINDEVWEYYQLKEGKQMANVKGKWVPMNSSWAQRFPSMRGIPKAYIKIENVQQLKIESEALVPTIYHPFTIMEYEKNNSLFYDFVYVTVDSSEVGFREKIQEFFGEYRYFENRNGKYLIEPFVNNPLISEFDIMYPSPEELRQKNNSANSHLDLLTLRIKHNSFDSFTLDELKIFIDNNLNLDLLKICSDEIMLNPGIWFTGQSLTNESANFLIECDNRNKIDELIDNLTQNHNLNF